MPPSRIEAGAALDPRTKEYVKLGLPYGEKPRLVLIHLASEAIRTQSPVIDVEDSMTAFAPVARSGDQRAPPARLERPDWPPRFRHHPNGDGREGTGGAGPNPGRLGFRSLVSRRGIATGIMAFDRSVKSRILREPLPARHSARQSGRGSDRQLSDCPRRLCLAGTAASTASARSSRNSSPGRMPTSSSARGMPGSGIFGRSSWRPSEKSAMYTPIAGSRPTRKESTYTTVRRRLFPTRLTPSSGEGDERITVIRSRIFPEREIPGDGQMVSPGKRERHRGHSVALHEKASRTVIRSRLGISRISEKLSTVIRSRPPRSFGRGHQRISAGRLRSFGRPNLYIPIFFFL